MLQQERCNLSKERGGMCKVYLRKRRLTCTSCMFVYVLRVLVLVGAFASPRKAVSLEVRAMTHDPIKITDGERILELKHK